MVAWWSEILLNNFTQMEVYILFIQRCYSSFRQLHFSIHVRKKYFGSVLHLQNILWHYSIWIYLIFGMEYIKKDLS